MQRAAFPLISLTTQEEIIRFLDTSTKSIWEEDYSGGLIPKSFGYPLNNSLDTYVREMGYNTRVVAFFYDKAEYSEEIKLLRLNAIHMSNRYNLRIGIVTDQDLINEMKQKNPEFFNEVGLSVMVLRRYDGELFKVNLADLSTNEYNWWITDKSSKPVDRQTVAIFQMSELAYMPVCTIYVSFADPEVSAKSSALINLFREIKP